MLQKLLIFPGDWHTLANFQPVLMKAYYNAGLKEIAMASGFRGETLNSLEKCSHFKRTHNFLLQVWEALYQQMLTAYTKATPSSESLTKSLHDLLNKHGESSTEILKHAEQLINRSDNYNKFLSFVETCSEQDDTWKFWANFVLHDCVSYIGLYLGIRNNKWDLRLASLKMMAPLFTAFDRVHYQKLIPHHLADLQNFPDKILKSFQAGAFAVSLTGNKGHSVALDEAHEMCVNKDMKAAIVRPTKAYLQKTSLFLRYRIAAYKALIKQVYPPPGDIKEPEDTLLCKIKHRNENVSAMMKCIQEFNLLPPNIPSNRGLINVFSGTVATPEQRHDLLNFRTIGYNQMILYIKQRILKVPSTSAPVRQQRLLTFSTNQKKKKRLNHKERESKQMTKCLRQRLAWCNRTGQSYDPTTEQYSVYPRAICDETGNPNKGTKASWTDKLRKRYELATPPVALDILPTGWVPEAVIIDGMFLIQCAPLRQTATISRYAEMLFSRFILSHFDNGAVEVHLIFDSPSVQPFNPKQMERMRRDNTHTDTSNHEHICFTPSSKILSTSWRTLLECRTCKQSITAAISLAYLQIANVKLAAYHKLIIAGSLPDTWEISGCNPPQIRSMYNTNAEEADMRIWRHAYQSKATKILIYSPDTDVYNIGMSLTSITSHQDCIVQINLPHTREQKFISLTNLLKALDNDPDLAGIPRKLLANIFQVFRV